MDPEHSKHQRDSGILQQPQRQDRESADIPADEVLVGCCQAQMLETRAPL